MSPLYSVPSQGKQILDTPAHIDIEETTTTSLQARLQTAFQIWRKGSNGQTEARQFTIKGGFDDNLILNTLLLLDLGLERLKDALPDQVYIQRIDGTQVMNLLIAAAAIVELTT